MKLTALKLLHGGLALLLASSLSAQSLQWDANGTDASVTDGGGTWNTSNSNWWTGTTNQSWNNSVNTIAVFGNGGVPGITTGAATINVSGTVNAGGLQFNAIDLTAAENRAYVLSGGTINLSEGAFIRVANGSSNTGNARITLNSSLAGNNISIEKSGADLGLIHLAGTNTWTGTLTLTDASGSGGIFLNTLNVAALTSLSAINVQTGNTLVINYGQATLMDVALQLAGSGGSSRGAIRFDQTRTLSGNVTLMANTGISANTTSSPTGTLAGNIGESGGSRSLTINTLNTTGTIVLSGNNTFTGGVIVNSGTLSLGSTGALNSTAPNLVTFANNTNAKFLTLNGFSTVVSGLSTTGSTDTVTVQNANASAATLTIANSSAQTFRGILADGTGGGTLSIVKTGSGTQTLTRASTYTGSTTLKAGTLELDFSASGAPASNILSSSSTLITNGGMLSLKGGSSVANSQTVNGLTIAAGRSTITLITHATPKDLVLNLGAITSQKGGSINFVLPSGAQTVTNGIRTSSSNDASGILGGWATVNGADWATVSGGNIIAYTGYTQVTNFSTGAGSVGPIPNTATANIKIIDGGTSGNVALANSGATTDINTLVQSVTGATVIGSGSGDTLRLGTSGGIMLASGAGDLTIGSAANNGSVLTAGGSTTDTAGQLIFSDQTSGQTTTVNSIINDNGSGGTVNVVKNGPGTLILQGSTSDYSGGTFLNGGIIRIATDRSLGAIPGVFAADNLTFNGGTLQWGAALTLNANRGITLLAGGGTLDLQSQSTTYAGSITGSGSLTKNGNGLLVLSGANNYTGETTITTGVLAITNNQALGSNLGGTIVLNNAQLRLDSSMTIAGETVTINGNGGNNNGALQANTDVTAVWTGNVIIGTNLSRIGGQKNSFLNVTGVIQNGSSSSNSLAISTAGDNGVVQLSGVNTYTGSTQIVRGTLRIGANNSLPTTTALTVYTAGTVTETTMFDLNGFNQEIAGLNSIVPNGSNDVVSVNNSNASTASTLTINQAGNSTFNGKIMGNLSIIKDGAGTLTLTNTYNATSPVATVSNYTGKTTIRGGTLALSGTGNLTGTPWIQVDQGATFSISGRSSGNYTLTNQVLSGRGSVNGQLIVSGNSYISPGTSSGLLANAGDGTGELTFNDLTLTGGIPTLRALFQLGATNSNLSDILAGGDPAYFANASSDGLYDSLQVNGTLGLNAGSTLKVELLGSYVPQLGDVFNLLDWVTALNADADGAGGAGAFTVADLDLSSANAILAGNGWFFETNQFMNNGLIYVAAIPEPSRLLLFAFGFLTLFMRRRR